MGEKGEGATMGGPVTTVGEMRDHHVLVQVPFLSFKPSAVIGPVSDDNRTVTNHRASNGGHIHFHGDTGAHAPTTPTGDDDSNIDSVGSIGSINSIGSMGSVASIGSAGSVFSIGSAGSVLSIGSAGSVLSIGSAGSVLSIGSLGSIGAIGGRRQINPRIVQPAASMLGVFVLARALVSLFR
jgi:hypothetical protein